MSSTFWSTIIGLVIGAIKSLMEQKAKDDKARWEYVLKANKMEVEDRQDARKMQNKEVQFSRRVIVISMCLAFFIAPVVFSFIHPYATINIPVNRTIGGIIGWIIGKKEVVDYISVTGFTFVASLVDSFMLVVGYYFGSGGTRK